MKLFGYAANASDEGPVVPAELAEITLVASPAELRAIANFLQSAAEGIESKGTDWEHEHLADMHKEFSTSPHFVVFNPAVS